MKKIRKSVCGQCPFRKNTKVVLSKERIKEIHQKCVEGEQHFICHVDSMNEDKENTVCAGYAVYAQNEGKTNLYLRIALINRGKEPIKNADKVVSSKEELFENHSM